jgi:hypothetical protein
MLSVDHERSYVRTFRYSGVWLFLPLYITSSLKLLLQSRHSNHSQTFIYNAIVPVTLLQTKNYHPCRSEQEILGNSYK